jgi:putative phosphoribosyl transferase
MTHLFRDRTEAGQLLGRALLQYAHRDDVIVLGLPRGGVPVAFEVAKALKAPLEIFVVRKLGVPGHRELAMGAIATGGVCVLNQEVIAELGIADHTIDEVAAEERIELARRETAYRGHDIPPDLRNKVAILVDDGIATGSTMRAAVRAVRLQKAARIVVAVPTSARPSYDGVKREADEVISLMRPLDFSSVGEWYEDFSQTTDQDVTRLLAEANHNPEFHRLAHR